MFLETALFVFYRLLALTIAVAMVDVILRARDWRQQFFAVLVLVPFALRAVGIK